MKVIAAALPLTAVTAVFAAKTAPVYPLVPVPLMAAARAAAPPVTRFAATTWFAGFRLRLCGGLESVDLAANRYGVAGSDNASFRYRVGGSGGAGPRRGSRQHLAGLGGEVDRARSKGGRGVGESVKLRARRQQAVGLGGSHKRAAGQDVGGLGGWCRYSFGQRGRRWSSAYAKAGGGQQAGGHTDGAAAGTLPSLKKTLRVLLVNTCPPLKLVVDPILLISALID